MEKADHRVKQLVLVARHIWPPPDLTAAEALTVVIDGTSQVDGLARLAGRLVRHQRAYRWFRPVTEPIRYRDSREAVPAAFRPTPLQTRGRQARDVASPRTVADAVRAESYRNEEGYQREPLTK